MTKRTTSKKSKKATVPCGPSKPFDLDRFKNMVIIALIAVLVGVSAAFCVGLQTLRAQLKEANSAVCDND